MEDGEDLEDDGEDDDEEDAGDDDEDDGMFKKITLQMMNLLRDKKEKANRWAANLRNNSKDKAVRGRNSIIISKEDREAEK